MTDCPGCANPSGGVYVRGCRPCALRDLAAELEKGAPAQSNAPDCVPGV